MRPDGMKIALLLSVFALPGLAACAHSLVATASGRGVAAPSDFRHRVDLNGADGDELALLPGIGPVRANAIIEHRVLSLFGSADDLKNVQYRGGRAVFNEEAVRQLRDHVTVTRPEKPAGGAR